MDFKEPTEEKYVKAYKYAKTIMNAFRDEDFIIMWDVINKPMCNDYLHNCLATEYRNDILNATEYCVNILF